MSEAASAPPRLPAGARPGDIAALTVGDCANEAAIRRAMGRLREDAARLPLDTAGAKAMKLVRGVQAEARDALSLCP